MNFLEKLDDKNKTYVKWGFIAISIFIYVFYSLNLLEKRIANLDGLVILKESVPVIHNWLAWAIIQWQISFFPLFLFIASFWKGSIVKRTLIMYPFAYIIGDNFFDIVLDKLGEFYFREVDNGTLIKTIINSPQASLLVILIICLFVSAYFLFIKKRKIFWFSFLTILAFLSMNIIYHVGLINGTLRDTVNHINEKQERLISGLDAGLSEDEFQQICDFEEWKCVKFETTGMNDLNFLNEFKGYIAKPGIQYLHNIYAKKLAQQSFKYYILRRNFSIPQDDSAYVGFTRVKYDKENNIYSGILIVDAVYFKNYFILADVYLTKMLAWGNIFWLIMMMFVVSYHEKFLNKKKVGKPS